MPQIGGYAAAELAGFKEIGADERRPHNFGITDSPKVRIAARA